MSWVERAERALDAKGAPLEEGEVVLRGARPPILDAEGVRAVAAPLFAAVKRETSQPSALSSPMMAWTCVCAAWPGRGFSSAR